MSNNQELRMDGPNWLRLSKSGYSLRVGWGDEKRIVATCPGTSQTQHADPEIFQQWMLDAERLCNGWNRDNSASATDSATAAVMERAEKAEAELAAEKQRKGEAGGRLVGAIHALHLCKPLIAPKDWPEYAQQVLDLNAALERSKP